MLNAIEKITGKAFPEKEVSRLSRGAGELDLVNSGLEDTMIDAYHEIREIHKQHGTDIDLRIASFISAINKIARSYLELGIFP